MVPMPVQLQCVEVPSPHLVHRAANALSPLELELQPQVEVRSFRHTSCSVLQSSRRVYNKSTVSVVFQIMRDSVARGVVLAVRCRSMVSPKGGWGRAAGGEGHISGPLPNSGGIGMHSVAVLGGSLCKGPARDQEILSRTLRLVRLTFRLLREPGICYMGFQSALPTRIRGHCHTMYFNCFHRSCFPSGLYWPDIFLQMQTLLSNGRVHDIVVHPVTGAATSMSIGHQGQGVLAFGADGGYINGVTQCLPCRVTCSSPPTLTRPPCPLIWYTIWLLSLCATQGMPA